MTRTSITRIDLVPVLLALPLFACGVDKDLGSPTPQGGSDDSSTGSDQATSTVASDTSGTANTSITSEESSGSGGESTSGADLECGPETAVLVTEIDGVQEGVQWEPIGLFIDGVGPGLVFGGGGDGFGLDGIIHIRASQEAIDAPGPLHASGYLREPFDAPTHPNAWYCFDDTTEFVDDDPAVVSFAGLRRFGPCPGGEPVDGSITVCFGDPSCGGAETVDVVIGDVVYTETESGSNSAESEPELLAEFIVGSDVPGSAGLLGFRATSYQVDAVGMQSSDLTDAFYIVPPGHPDAGAIYCGGEGSSLSYGGGDHLYGLISAELVGLTRLGSCSDEGPTDGSGMFCSGFGG